MIGMWGSRRAGKSTFLAALYYEVIQRSETEDERWSMMGRGPAADFIEEAYKNFVGQRFPGLTRPEGTLDPLRFDVTRPLTSTSRTEGAEPGGSWWSRFVSKIRTLLRQLSEGGADVTQIELNMFDPSGELFLDPQRLMSDVDPSAAQCRQMLSNSHGLLCMIDPEPEDNEHYFPIIWRNFLNLSELMNGPGGGPLPIPVAICVTKCDQYPNAFDDPRAFLRNRMGLTAFKALSDFCPQRSYFAVSAIGRDNLFVGEDGKARPKGEPKPINVLQPIEWLSDTMR